MDIKVLKQCLEDRLQLLEKHQAYIGRHQFFNKHLPKLQRGISIVIKKDPTTLELEELYVLGKNFIKIRDAELKSHLSRFNTLAGNKIHQSEHYLYSMALDVFQTYGVME